MRKKRKQKYEFSKRLQAVTGKPCRGNGYGRSRAGSAFEAWTINMGMLLLLPSIASGIFWHTRGLFASWCRSPLRFFLRAALPESDVDLRFLRAFWCLSWFPRNELFRKSMRQNGKLAAQGTFVYSLYCSQRTKWRSRWTIIFERAVKKHCEAFETNVVISCRRGRQIEGQSTK